MAEKVLVAAVGSPTRTVFMDARVAKELVARGRFRYIDKQLTPEPVAVEQPAAEPAKPKKRAYKRRDMKAED